MDRLIDINAKPGVSNQGRTEKLKRGGETEGGGGILRKIYCFREILNKLSQNNVIFKILLSNFSILLFSKDHRKKIGP